MVAVLDKARRLQSRHWAYRKPRELESECNNESDCEDDFMDCHSMDRFKQCSTVRLSLAGPRLEKSKPTRQKVTRQLQRPVARIRPVVMDDMLLEAGEFADDEFADDPLRDDDDLFFEDEMVLEDELFFGPLSDEEELEFGADIDAEVDNDAINDAINDAAPEPVSDTSTDSELEPGEESDDGFEEQQTSPALSTIDSGTTTMAPVFTSVVTSTIWATSVPTVTYVSLRPLPQQPRKGLEEFSPLPTDTEAIPLTDNDASAVITSTPGATEAANSMMDGYEMTIDPGEHMAMKHALIAIFSISIFATVSAAIFYMWKLLKQRQKSKQQRLSRISSVGKFNDDHNDEDDCEKPAPLNGHAMGFTQHSTFSKETSQSAQGVGAQNFSGGPSIPLPYFRESQQSNYQTQNTMPATKPPMARASGVSSSISSGLGDDKFVDEKLGTAEMLPPQPSHAPPQRASWKSNGQRETIFTVSSEDSPARFRTLDSWVNQQTGRVRRAQQRAENGEEIPDVPTLPGSLPGIPGIPLPNGLPEEPRYTMLNNSFMILNNNFKEEPRRPTIV